MKRTTCIAKTFAVIVLLGALTAGCTHDEVREETTPKTAAPSTSTEATATIAKEDTLLSAMPTTLDLHPDVRVKVSKGKAFVMQLDGMMLAAVDSAVLHDGTYTATALNEGELPKLPSDHVNVTAGSGAGYRLLPGGEHFSPYAELRVAYDEGKLPRGYTPDDIHTSYYDTETGVWTRLVRKEVDTLNKEIVSLTTHFTDFVNEVLKAPEMPETQAFVPTMMSELEAANPLEGLTLIQPPTANNNGTANLSYPLQIPAGRQGMQPNLALTYNSNGGNGVCGQGWDLTIPCVSVETRWGVPLYNPASETETYLLNGEQLLVAYDSLPTFARQFEPRDITQTEKRFYPRVEGAFDSIIRHGTHPGNYWWEVVDRNGTHYYYGNSDQDPSSHCVLTDDTPSKNIAKWYLNKVVDKNGNCMRYFYEQYYNTSVYGNVSGKYIYLTQVLYTLPQSTEGLTHWYGHSVSFDYSTSRPDPIISGNYGTKENIQLLLDSIKVNYVKFVPNTCNRDSVLQHIVDSILTKDPTMTETFQGLTNDSIISFLNIKFGITIPECDEQLPEQFNMECVDAKMIRGYRLLYESAPKTKKTLLWALVEMSASEWGAYAKNPTISSRNNNHLKYHRFEYNELNSEDMFEEETISISTGLKNARPNEYNRMSHVDASPLGGSVSSGYGVNVGVGVGIDKKAWLRSLNIDANGSVDFGNKSEGETALVDLNGDGYMDLLYRKSYEDFEFQCKLFDPISENFSDPSPVEMVLKNFLSDKTKKSYSVGPSANAGMEFPENQEGGVVSSISSIGVNLGYMYSSNKGYNEVYYTDVNADGKVDIVSNGIVYFNTSDESNISFSDEPAYATETLQACSNSYFSLNDADTVETELFQAGNEMVTTVFSPSERSDDPSLSAPLQPTYDTTRLAESNPDTLRRNAVRVWIAPKSGTVKVSGQAWLDTAFTAVRERSESDGVNLYVQHNSDILLRDSLYSGWPATIRTEYIDDFRVSRFDRIYFRVEAKKNDLYDNVIWSPVVYYTDEDTTSKDYESRNLYRYDSHKDFFAWNAEQFYMPINETITIDTRYRITKAFSDTVRLSAKVYDTLDNCTRTLLDTVINPNRSGTGGSLQNATLNEGDRIEFVAHSNHDVDWTKLEWNPHVKTTDSYNVMPMTGDTIYDIDLYLSPTFRTFYTFQVSESITPILNDRIQIKDSLQVIQDREFQLVRRTNSEIQIIDRGILSQDIINISLLSVQPGFYELYIQGQAPQNPSGIQARTTLSNQPIGIKFDSVFWGETTDTVSPEFRCFGSMNHQWGQFAYNCDTIGVPIVENTIKKDPRSDTSNIRGNVTSLIIDTIEVNASTFGTTISNCPNPDNATVGNMTATFDTLTQKRIWTSYAFRTYVTPEEISVYNWQETRRDRQDSMITMLVTNTSLSMIRGKGVGPIRESFQESDNYHANASFRKLFEDLDDADLSGCFSFSNGSNRLLQDFMDMNGDGYPDIVNENAIQYTNPRGGLSSKCEGAAPNKVQGVQVTKFKSYNMQACSSYPIFSKLAKRLASATNHSQKKDSDVDNANQSTSPNFDLNASGSLVKSYENLDVAWIDMNGDGLPDKVNGDTVYLNLGYAYYHGGKLANNPLAKSSSFNYSGGISPSINGDGIWSLSDVKMNYSFSAGMNINYSNNSSNTLYADVNGDGLVDKVEDGEVIHFNTGWGFSSDTANSSYQLFSSSRTDYDDINGQITVGVPLAFCKIQASAGAKSFVSATNTKSVFLDMNADGLPDMVTFENNDDDDIVIRYNKLYKVDKLKEVKSFSGNIIHIQYAQADYSPNSQHRPTVMSSLSVRDTFSGDSMYFEFSYNNYYNSKTERTPYGFETVTVTQFNQGSAYRKTEQTYHNDKYKFRGLKRSEETSECTNGGNTRRLSRQEWHYVMKEINTGNVVPDSIAHCFGPTYPALDSTSVTLYDPATGTAKLTTAERYGHGPFGLNDTVTLHNDLLSHDDDLTVLLTYFPSRGNNLSALVSTHEVRHGSDLLRKQEAAYDASGNLSTLIQHNNAVQHDAHYKYDSYGNIIAVRMPSNRTDGVRLTYHYTYDTLLFQFPTIIRDSAFGLVSKTEYDVEIGKPMTVFSISGDSISYYYDDWGRILAIRAPQEANTVLPPTIEYFRWDETPERTPSCTNNFRGTTRKHRRDPFSHPRPSIQESRPWAQTCHHTAFDTSQKIKTYLFTDGFGRVAQTRKTAVVDGVIKQVASGMTLYDDLGRVVRTYDPFVVSDTNRHYVTPVTTNTYTVTTYDPLDRKTSETVHFDGSTLPTTYRYGFSNVEGLNVVTQAITDPHGSTTTVSTDSRGLKYRIVNPLGDSTIFRYDALGQLVESIDPEGFSTLYTYDMLGALLSRDHPDAGLTAYKYDKLGQITEEHNANGETITYLYDFNRLTDKQYSNIPANDVHYDYGNASAGNATGRIVEIYEGSGMQNLSYDDLGNISQNIRTFALPFDNQSYTFTMDFEYDSWGRIVSIVYPDGEVVRYTYNKGGDLFAVSGQKGTFSYQYIDSIWYNAYGGKDLQWYGNGTFAQYSYDGLHRLSHLLTGNGSDVMQDIDYTYDNVGNIIEVADSASSIGSLGATSLDNYFYDALGRLSIADLNYGSNQEEYLASYSGSGRMMHKYHPRVPETPYQNLFFGYCNKRQPHAPRRIVNFTQDPSWDIHDLSWDKKGNLVRTASYLDGRTEPALTRHLFWTEDNRLHTVVDENYYSYYAYDYTGERVLKLTGDSKLLDVNGYPMATGMLDNVTLYTSPYLIVTSKEYTKHYYAGSERICAKLGNGGFTEASFTASMKVATDLFKLCQKSMNRKPEKQEAFCVQILGDGPGELMSTKLEPPATTTLSDIKVKEDMILNGIMLYMHDPGCPERDIFFYHSDHLGSASWITDAIGTPIQHIRYLPYGETYVNERTSGYNERFTFTGKETDCETGYSYFGARYYDPTLLTSFLSIDRYADKYPSLSPYHYCAWNPVKLIDPSGDTVINPYTKKIEQLKATIENINQQINRCNSEDKSQLRKLKRELKINNRSLEIQKKNEHLVNAAINELKTFGGDEFDRLDNLHDKNGNIVNVYIDIADKLKDHKCGVTKCRIGQNGETTSKYGDNSVAICLSKEWKSIIGETLAHEGGHVLYEVMYPQILLEFYHSNPEVKRDGHSGGNPSGESADYFENRFRINKKANK